MPLACAPGGTTGGEKASHTCGGAAPAEGAPKPTTAATRAATTQSRRIPQTYRTPSAAAEDVPPPEHNVCVWFHAGGAQNRTQIQRHEMCASSRALCAQKYAQILFTWGRGRRGGGRGARRG